MTIPGIVVFVRNRPEQQILLELGIGMLSLNKQQNSKPAEKDHERILVVKLYAIGDFIMSLPGLEFLRRRNPDAEIHLLTGSIIAPLARCSAPVNKIIQVNEKHFTERHRLLSLVPLISALRKQRYTRAYLLHRVLPLRLFLLATGARDRIGQGNSKMGLTDTVPFETGRTEHDAERYARLFGWTGSELLPESVASIPEYPAGSPIASAIDSRPIAVSPGGGKSSIRDMNWKRWPAQRFRELIDLLHGENINTVVLGSREDRNVIGSVLDNLPHTSTDLVGRTSLVDAAAILSGCRMLITNDSSLMHIAGLVSIPSIALFGPTDPSRIGIYPPSPYHRNLISGGTPCRPCHPDRGIKGCETAECMFSISLESVWEETRKLLRETETQRHSVSD